MNRVGFKKRVLKGTTRRGFSLIELLVTLAIFAILTTIVLTKNAQFNGTILIHDLAYDVALSIRQAQVYGLSVRGTTGASPSFTVGYGVNFTINNPSSYILFADANNNIKYDTSPSEALQVYNLNNGNQISKLCGTDSNGVQTCSDTGSLTTIAIVFQRPNLDAHIRGNVTGGDYQAATITVSSPQGSSQTVTVTSNGQISVSQ